VAALASNRARAAPSRSNRYLNRVRGQRHCRWSPSGRPRWRGGRPSCHRDDNTTCGVQNQHFSLDEVRLKATTDPAKAANAHGPYRNVAFRRRRSARRALRRPPTRNPDQRTRACSMRRRRRPVAQHIGRSNVIHTPRPTRSNACGCPRPYLSGNSGKRWILVVGSHPKTTFAYAGLPRPARFAPILSRSACFEDSVGAPITVHRRTLDPAAIPVFTQRAGAQLYVLVSPTRARFRLLSAYRTCYPGRRLLRGP